MIACVVKTPNAAKPVAGTGCVAVVAGDRCPSAARWTLEADDGRRVPVCRLHANKAERRGELLVGGE